MLLDIDSSCYCLRHCPWSGAGCSRRLLNRSSCLLYGTVVELSCLRLQHWLRQVGHRSIAENRPGEGGRLSKSRNRDSCLESQDCCNCDYLVVEFHLIHLPGARFFVSCVLLTRTPRWACPGLHFVYSNCAGDRCWNLIFDSVFVDIGCDTRFSPSEIGRTIYIVDVRLKSIPLFLYDVL